MVLLQGNYENMCNFYIFFKIFAILSHIEWCPIEKQKIIFKVENYWEDGSLKLKFSVLEFYLKV